MQERLTRQITESEIKLFNLTRPSGSKYSEGDYVEKRDVTDLECYRKLGQLEDIEKELGIELVVLFKALKEGIYFKYYNEGIIHYSNDVEKISPTFEIKYELCCNFQSLIIISEEQKDDGGWLKIDNNVWHLKYSDYGKTWALTKEELI